MDEGAQNVATNLAKTLSQKDEVLVIHQRKALLPINLKKAMRFKPDIIISIHGPSPKTVLLFSLLRILSGKPEVVVIGAQPHDNPLMLVMLRLIKPALVFAQSSKWYKKFNDAGLCVYMLPNGVDTEKFIPSEDSFAENKLRQQLGLQKGSKILLHIGPINHNRNHELLMRIQRETSWQVLVIGSTTAPFVQNLAEKLMQSGVSVHATYFPDINQVYAMADAYIFPVMDETGSIEFPLTVLEAMACDRPVVTYPFKGLPDFLPASESLRYFHSFEELCSILPELENKHGNRGVAETLSWNNVAEQFRERVKSELGIF
ncbi:MAG: glycosyltransferase family 4 protein [Candidatus Heimdallarchaeota archaeon]|nr:glycosyltransferase family 4 protein [Candidatus Heimdallarchaeota archaeon]